MSDSDATSLLIKSNSYCFFTVTSSIVFFAESNCSVSNLHAQSAFSKESFTCLSSS